MSADEPEPMPAAHAPAESEPDKNEPDGRAPDAEALRRWRLVLGRFAERRLDGACGGACLDGMDGRRDRALDYLYGREYGRRGLATRSRDGRRGGSRRGSLDPTQLEAVGWLGEARELFPRTTFETVRGHAIERYGMSELLADPKEIDDIEPDIGLLGAMMTLSGRGDARVRDALRRIARKVIDDLLQRLRPRVTRALSGQRDRFRRSNLKSSANFDWRRTVRENLRHYDPDRRVIVAERLAFVARRRRHLPWTVILCVDQSGSMTESLIHAAVMAAILSGLPGIEVKMVLFDTEIVDLTDRLDDPLDVILSVRMGGGTDIGRAVSYCEKLVDDPSRTVFALVSDFYEGPAPRRLYAAVTRLAEARVRLIGLAALDEGGQPDFDRDIAGRLAELGMSVAAMTPDTFAEWFAGQLR